MYALKNQNDQAGDQVDHCNKDHYIDQYIPGSILHIQPVENIGRDILHTYRIPGLGEIADVINIFRSLVDLPVILYKDLVTTGFIGLPVIQTLDQLYITNSKCFIVFFDPCFVYTRDR